jgi:hypothetical protein
LIDTLADYDPTYRGDGVAFEDVVGDAIFGIGTSPSGVKKIDAWIAEAKASPTNLIWRAIAMNQQDAIADVDAILSRIYGSAQPASLEYLQLAINEFKWNKIADVARDSLAFLNTNQKGKFDPKSGIKYIESKRGLDKILATAGHRMLKPLASVGDTLNVILLQMFLAARSTGEAAKVFSLAHTQIEYGRTERAALLKDVRSLAADSIVVAQAKANRISKKWADLVATADVADSKKQSFNAARDARLALVVTVFEGFNLWSARNELENDPASEKLQAMLLAAQLSASSAGLDVFANMVKGLISDQAQSYQALKFVGGTLSATASCIGAWLDSKKAFERARHDDWRLAILYSERAAFQFASGVLTALTTLSYASPTLELVGKKLASRVSTRVLGEVTIAVGARVLAARAALMLASLEVSLFVLSISVIIWVLEDDQLEKWCDRSAFGLKRQKLEDRYQTAEEQRAFLFSALSAVG